MNRKYSLKKKSEIEKLVKARQSVGNRNYAIYYQITTEETPKIAFSIVRKVKTAVKRNYEKRTAKEIFRKKLNELKYLQMLVVIKLPATELKFQEKEEQLNYLIKKMLRSKNEERN